MNTPRIVLASSSRYRRELLERLHLPFDVLVPDLDESRLPDESPRATALRLAQAKALAVAARSPGAVVIGSDQVADLDGEPLGKPHTHEAAVAQLSRMQGKLVVFHTALAVVAADGSVQAEVVPTLLRMRPLAPETIEAYLRLEQPYDCAGAAKIEKMGIAIVEAVDSTDPTALIGLPLIRLTTMLAVAGVPVLPGLSA
ncbi:MAG: Maf family nucleotide pyrophosphatase [Burkholderiaceae bacterium]